MEFNISLSIFKVPSNWEIKLNLKSDLQTTAITDQPKTATPYHTDKSIDLYILQMYIKATNLSSKI